MIRHQLIIYKNVEYSSFRIPLLIRLCSELLQKVNLLIRTCNNFHVVHVWLCLLKMSTLIRRYSDKLKWCKERPKSNSIILSAWRKCSLRERFKIYLFCKHKFTFAISYKVKYSLQYKQINFCKSLLRKFLNYFRFWDNSFISYKFQI